VNNIDQNTEKVVDTKTEIK